MNCTGRVVFRKLRPAAIVKIVLGVLQGTKSKQLRLMLVLFVLFVMFVIFVNSRRFGSRDDSGHSTLS